MHTQPPHASPVLVSACLLGHACRYDGQSKPSSAVQAFLQQTPHVAVCPEALGGLGTPRPPAELEGGDGSAVLSGDARVRRCHDGQDLTEQFLLGALCARMACPDAQLAILKARSPSCGVDITQIEGEKRPGDGVFAALLRGQGVTLLTDETLLQALSPAE